MEQQLCLNCSKPLIKVEGRKAKKYCDDKCRASHWNKHNKKKAPQWVSKEVYDELVEKYETLGSKYELAVQKLNTLMFTSVNRDASIGKDLPQVLEESKESDTVTITLRSGVNYEREGTITKEKKVPVIEDKVANTSTFLTPNSTLVNLSDKTVVKNKSRGMVEVEKISDIPEQKPVKGKNESGIDFSIRVSEWEAKQKMQSLLKQ